MDKSTTNPANSIDVLEPILKFIPSISLLSFRKISKTWNEASKLVIRKRRDIGIQICIRELQKNKEFLKYLQKNSTAFYPPCVEIFDETDYTERLNRYTALEEIPKEAVGVLEKIFIALGQNGIIRKLNIKLYREWESYAECLLKILPRLPNLEILIVELKNRPDPKAAPKMPEPLAKFELKCLNKLVVPNEHLFKIILKSAPNLKYISYGREYQSDPILLLKESGYLPQIRQLSVGADDVPLLLSEKTLDLKNLKLLKGKNNEGSKLLEKQKLKLCILFLHAPVKFPVMPILTKLVLDGDIIGQKGLKFARDTPNLKVLVMLRTGKNWKKDLLYQDNGGRVWPLESLEELKIMLESEDKKCWEYLGKLFPNLKKLHFHCISQNTLRGIGKAWPNLKDLHIHISRRTEINLLEEILFGIRNDWEDQIVQSRYAKSRASTRAKRQEVREVGWWADVELPEMECELRKMKGLKRLRIQGGESLTDFSVYFGLVHLRDLEYIRLDLSSITPEAENYIRNELQCLTYFDGSPHYVPPAEDIKNQFIRGFEGPKIDPNF